MRRPTPAELEAAAGRTLRDVIAPDLRVLFVGINPSLYSAAVGHHFARPGNRFWKALHGAGFTERVLYPFEDEALLDVGCGVTNLVARATRAASDLSDDELRAGGRRLGAKVRRYRPRVVAICGLGAARVALGQPSTSVGPLPDVLGEPRMWVVPNPSGLNASYQMPALVDAYGALRREAFGPD